VDNFLFGYFLKIVCNHGWKYSLIRVFICYGGTNGLSIGLRLRTYLLNNGLSPFLAGRGSPDIPAGENFDLIINEKLRNTHIMVTICDLNLMRSKYARKEIKTAQEEGILNIPFLLNGRKLPKQLERTWAPVKFDQANPEASFPQLLTEIQRSVIFRMEKFFVSLGNSPDAGLPIMVLRSGRI